MPSLHRKIYTIPLLLLRTALTLDTLTISLPHLPNNISATLLESLPNAFHQSLDLDLELSLPVLSYYILSLGLLTGLITVLTGLLSAAASLNNKENGKGKGKARINLNFKILAAHAILNDIALLGSAALWWMRREAAASASAYTGTGTGPRLYAAEAWMVGVSAVLIGVQFLGVSLGHKLIGSGSGSGKGKGKKEL